MTGKTLPDENESYLQGEVLYRGILAGIWNVFLRDAFPARMIAPGDLER
jgi:hypothetical protein